MNINSKGTVNWFILILASSAIIFTSFFLLRGSLKIPTYPKEEATKELSTADWKIYQNNELQYTFKYPKTWKLRESMSMGYLYISIFDPVVQAQAPDVTDFIQGAMVEIYTEEFRAVVPMTVYVRNLVTAGRGEDGDRLETQIEQSTSNVWGVSGPYLINRSGNVLQHLHAALIEYPETDLFIRIVLTVGDATPDQIDAYLATFDQILSSLTFNPPTNFPLPDFSKSP